ncbi:MAG TPA: efflux RND transporter permease subunit, partial [Vicinamibacterales bacterium]
IDYAGESRQLRTEGGTFLTTFLLSAILIYLVLAAQFESFVDPFIILAGSVPLALSGALLFSFLQFTTLNIYSQVGLITLVGLVSKNGILIVQFANHLQETGKDRLAAVIEAAGTRLRPILMTTAATVVGHLPLVFATGPGAGARNSIGTVLVSGMIVGTLFTLFVVPSIYVLLARRRSVVTEARRSGRVPELAAAVAIVLAIGITASPASAQIVAGTDRQVGPSAALRLTLDEAVRRAVENNPDLAIVRLDTEVEAARVGETRTAYTPVFSTTLGRSGNVTPPSNFLLGNDGVDNRDWFSSTGVRQRLRYGGGTWSASWDSSRTTTTNPISSFDPSLQTGFELAFSQPLLRDRQVDAARYQYVIAKRNQENSELRFRESAVQTIATVKQAYWTLKATRANVIVQQRSLELAAELARQTKIRVDAGQIPPLDLVQAEAEMAQRRENLIRARTGDDDAEDRLRRLIMDPADASFWRTHLDPIEEPVGQASMPDVDAVVEKALGQRIDLSRANLELENAKATVAFLDNQRLPDVRLETSYRGNGLAGSQFIRSGGFPGTIIGARSRNFGDALGQAFGPDYPAWSVGVTVSYPIGRSFDEASRARADVERRQTAERISSLRLAAAETIRQSGRQIRSSSERIDAARAGATLAQQRLDAEQRRYDAGLSTTFLVTQAQRDLLQAQVNLLQTTLDYESAVVIFEAVQQAPAGITGDTLAVRGASVVAVPTPAPHGLFRQAAGSGF